MSDVFEMFPRPWRVTDDEAIHMVDAGGVNVLNKDFAFRHVPHLEAIVAAVNAEPKLRARVAVLEGALRDIVERTGIATPYDEHTYECDLRFDRECDCIVGSMGEIANAALAGDKKGET